MIFVVETIFLWFLNDSSDNPYPVCFQGNHATAMVNGKEVFSKDIVMATTHGFIALGTDNFGLANFDNFEVWE